MRNVKVKPYTDLVLDVSVCAGKSIKTGLQQMIHLRNNLGINVRMIFNDVLICVYSDDQTVESLYQEYCEGLKNLGYET